MGSCLNLQSWCCLVAFVYRCRGNEVYSAKQCRGRLQMPQEHSKTTDHSFSLYFASSVCVCLSLSVFFSLYFSLFSYHLLLPCLLALGRSTQNCRLISSRILVWYFVLQFLTWRTTTLTAPLLLFQLNLNLLWQPLRLHTVLMNKLVPCAWPSSGALKVWGLRSLFAYLCLCLSLSFFLCLSICLSVFLSLSIYLSLTLLSVPLSLSFSFLLSLSLCLSYHLLFFLLSVYQLIGLSF